MLKNLLLGVCLLIFSFSFSQNQQKIDSLKQVVSTLPRDTNLVNTYEKIAKLYLRVQLDSTKVYAQKMIDLSEQLNYNKGLAMGNYWIGDSYIKQREFEKALVYFNNSKEIFGRSGNALFKTYIQATIANVYSMTNKQDTAIIIFNEVIKYHKKNNDVTSMAKVMVNLARVYSERGDLTHALQLLYSAKLEFKKKNNEYWLAATERSLAVVYQQLQEYDSAILINMRVRNYYQSINDDFRLGEVYSNIGGLFELKKFYYKALDAYIKSLEYRKKVGDAGGVAITRMNIAQTDISLNLFDSAMVQLEISRKILEKSNEIHAYVRNLILTGIYYNKTRQFNEAVKYLLKGYNIAVNHSLRESEQDIAKLLSEVYENMSDYKNALRFAKIYKLQYDSINNDKSIKEQTIIEEGYKYKLQLSKKEQEIEKEQSQKNYLIIISSAIIIFLVLLFFYWRKLQKAKLLQLEQQNSIKVKETSLKIQQAERKRVANILHDNLAHVIINSQTQVSKIISKTDNKEAEQKLIQLEENLEFMNKLAKVASYELEFSFVLDKNLVDQFAGYIARVEHSHSPNIVFNYSDKTQFDTLTDEIKINLFSVFQEMLGNAIKYAKAKTITVSLFKDDEKTILQVDDDGTGFNYDEVRHGQGFVNMKERAEKLNGKFTFESEIGFGTKLKFEV